MTKRYNGINMVGLSENRPSKLNSSHAKDKILISLMYVHCLQVAYIDHSLIPQLSRLSIRAQL